MPLMSKEQIAEIKDLHKLPNITVSPLYSSRAFDEGLKNLGNLLPDTKYFLYTFNNFMDYQSTEDLLKQDNNAFKEIMLCFFDDAKTLAYESQNDLEGYSSTEAILCNMEILHKYHEKLPEDLQKRYSDDELKEAVATFYYYIIDSYAKLTDNHNKYIGQIVYAEKINDGSLPEHNNNYNTHFQMKIYSDTLPDNLKQYIVKQMEELENDAREVTGKYPDGQDVYDRVQKQHSDTEKEMDTTELACAVQEAWVDSSARAPHMDF
ncbi:hypothetical protein RLOatenuis_7090 [Rickettsiales bacterium]|nr:hypothetical protein RLOatenuis_7090 [Rickettsiales bacterium]